MDFLNGLNSAQRTAVETIEGPVLILAGPGSGKTRVITQRIAYLTRVCHITPYHILAVTFTNKAAREMEERLKSLISGSISGLTLGTFHAICARLLRQDGKAAGIDSDFVIYDEDDQLNIIKRVFQEKNLDSKKYVPRAILSAISSAKSRLSGPQEFLQGGRSYFDEVVGRVFERYQQLLRESHALDFDDLLSKTVELFREHPEILEKYQQRYIHVLVDEFQDTNLVQFELVKLISAKYRNICVVGDPDQSIYSWRSADVRNILNFEKDFPDAKVILLEQNYRSTKRILETASHVIKSNRQRKQKDLWTDNEPGELTALIETYTEQEEAQFIVKEIERLVEEGQVKLEDCAVTYRTNAQSRIIEEAFVRYGLPYKLVAGTRFYERKEIKDVIAYLRLIQNPYDSVSLLRVINVPGRGIGQTTLDQLSAWVGSQGISLFEGLRRLSQPGTGNKVEHPFSLRTAKVLAGFGNLLNELIKASADKNLIEFFDELVIRSGYKDYLLAEDAGDERWDNVMELRTVAETYRDVPFQEGLKAFLEGVALVSDLDSIDDAGGKVTLITLHQAKGLEFGVVFIAGMEEGLLPHFRTLDDPQQLEEERRLCYVGITRAKKRIYLVHAFRRSLMGRSMVNKPSRFLQDIPRSLVSGGEIWQAAENRLGMDYSAADRKPAPLPDMPRSEFKDGDRVVHPIFGKGIVLSCNIRPDDCEVVVAFTGAGIKKLLLSFAKLEKTD